MSRIQHRWCGLLILFFISCGNPHVEPVDSSNTDADVSDTDSSDSADVPLDHETVDAETNGAEVYDCSQCDDQNLCNGVEICSPSTGECLAGEPVVCDDGDLCNGLETCVPETGQCDPGEPIECEDGIDCTVDSCNPETGGCKSELSDETCADSNPCTIDFCDPVSDCINFPKECDDENPCTDDSCDMNSGECVFQPIDCNDGNVCNGFEVCDSETGGCSPGVAIDCNDGNACNGEEICDPSTGGCLPGTAVVCDDGIGCNGVEYCLYETGACTPSDEPICPDSAYACGDLMIGTGPQSGNTLEATSSDRFILVPEGDSEWVEKDAMIDALPEHPSVTAVSMNTVFNDLNREGSSFNGWLTIDCFQRGFDWNSGDSNVEHWWPQGVTGTSDAYGDNTETGLYEGRRLMLVSWYHKDWLDPNADGTKGARITVVDLTNIDAVTYRHILLVVPFASAAGIPNFHALHDGNGGALHAGGIVWYKNLLYVADTHHGFRVFDLERMLQVSTGTHDVIGYDLATGGYHGANYKYVLPEIGRYNLCSESCCTRFSYSSLDRSASPPSILAGAYSSSATDTLLHRWPLDASNGLLKTSDQGTVDGAVVAENIYFSGRPKIQGALSYGGDYYLSSSKAKTSFPPSAGSLWSGGLGESWTDHQYPYLPEDLYFDQFTDELWTCTEHPSSTLGQRHCFSISRSNIPWCN